jgi:four helix bundle protein
MDNDWTELDVSDSYMVNDPGVPYGKQSSEREQYIARMRKRTRAAAVAVIDFISTCKYSPAMKVISHQIIKSASSTAANYRAACVARSGREFFAKISIVVEEADETVFWLELMYEANLPLDKSKIVALGNEWREISKIVTKSRKSYKAR